MKDRFPFKLQLAFAFFLALALAISLTSWLLFRVSERFFLGGLQDRLKNQAAIIALTIDGDLHQQVRTPQDSAYRTIRRQLVAFREVSPLVRDIYTVQPLFPERKIWQFKVDAEPPTGPIYSAPGRRYDATQDPLLPQGLMKPVSSRQLYTDEYGTWLSGYAPIRRKDGVAVAVVGVDISAQTFMEQRAALRRMVLASFLLALLLASLIALPFFLRILEPVEVERRIHREQLESLRAADRVKDHFLSVISHELRTPLNGIMGFGSILQDELLGPLTAPQLDALGRIMQSSDHMLELVDNLLDYSRMKAGKFQVAPAETDYPALVREVVARMLPLAEEKEIGLTCELAVSSKVFLDPPRISQVLVNLLSNSIKFTPCGGSIGVKAFVEGEHLVTEIRDNGIGIPSEELPRLFLPFQQLNMELTREAGGTGLGLAISKEIVSLHHGWIEAESEGKGKGATFRFVLPLTGDR